MSVHKKSTVGPAPLQDSSLPRGDSEIQAVYVL